MRSERLGIVCTVVGISLATVAADGGAVGSAFYVFAVGAVLCFVAAFWLIG